MGKTDPNNIENYFEWWLDEAKDYGYIHSYSRESEVFQVFPPYIGQRKKYLKTQDPKVETFAVLQKTEYTYDYRINWTEKALFIFYQPMDFSDPKVLQTEIYKDTMFYAHWDKDSRFWVSDVDVKPPSLAAQFSGRLSSFHTFPVKQAAILWLHGRYINKVIPIPMKGSGHTIALFPNTFTPRRYLLSDGATVTRAIRFVCITIVKYVAQRENYINSVVNQQKSIRDKKVEQGELFKQ